MVEGEKLRTLKMRLKASKQCVPGNSHELYNIRHSASFSPVSIQSKKPSGGRRALLVTHAMGLHFYQGQDQAEDYKKKKY